MRTQSHARAMSRCTAMTTMGVHGDNTDNSDNDNKGSHGNDNANDEARPTNDNDSTNDIPLPHHPCWRLPHCLPRQPPPPTTAMTTASAARWKWSKEVMTRPGRSRSTRDGRRLPLPSKPLVCIPSLLHTHSLTTCKTQPSHHPVPPPNANSMMPCECLPPPQAPRKWHTWDWMPTTRRRGCPTQIIPVDRGREDQGKPSHPIPPISRMLTPQLAPMNASHRAPRPSP